MDLGFARFDKKKNKSHTRNYSPKGLYADIFKSYAQVEHVKYEFHKFVA